MIPAEHRKWADWIFYFYISALFKRHFYSIYLLKPIPAFDLSKPVLLLPNHSSWWDGFFIYVLNKRYIKRRVFLMMLEEQLKKNSFFRYLGAYSVNQGNSRDVKQSLQYTIDLLNGREGNPLVCFFPQGELLPWNKRPLNFRRGLEYILDHIKSEVQICFLGIRIEFLNEQRPEVFTQFSSVKYVNSSTHYSIQALESEFDSQLSHMEQKIIEGAESEVLFHGRKSVNERFHTFWKNGDNS